MWRELNDGRFSWAFAFAVALAAVCAAPGFADGPSGSPTAPPAADTQPGAAMLPTPEQIAAALAAEQAESEARENWIAGPQAAQERARSALAYTDLSAPAAEGLLASQFAETLAALDSDPSRLLSEATLDRVLAPTVATVSEDGSTALVDSTLPVRTEDSSGRLAKVDLTLRQGPAGFEPRNPLAPVSIPPLADEVVGLAPSGLGIAQVDAAPSSAGRRFAAGNVFYPEVAPDTDLMVSPVSSGVELFDQLRSPESPETLTFELELPPGATLEGVGGGAEVLDASGQAVAQIAPPRAVDAQGAEVASSLQVRGSSLVLRVPRRAGQYAYPILLDPEISENWLNPSWFNGAGLGALSDGSWQWTSATGGVLSSTEPIFGQFGGSNRGLFASIPSGNLTPDLDGHWAYGVPKPNAFISRASLAPFLRDNHACEPSGTRFRNPHDYDGMWDGSRFVQLSTNDADAQGFSNLQGSTAAKSLIVGLNSGPSALDMPCWRDLYVGGVQIWLEDSDQPVLVTTPSAEWMDSVPIREAVSATDAGLGVKRFTTEAIDVAGDPSWETVNPCTGLHAAPCPETWNLGDPAQPLLNFEPSALPEGIDHLRITAYDVTEEPSTTSNTITVRVDHSAPALAVSGTLTEQAKLGTMRPSYTIRVAATDGVPGSDDPSLARAGVKSLRFFEDGTEIEPGRSQPECTGTQSCSVTREYEIPTLSRAVGRHVVTVVAEDTLGHQATREVPFAIERDSRPPQLSVTNLPDHGIFGPHPPEIAASASDEDRGVISLALQIDGRTVEEARQPCPRGGCGLQHGFAPDLSGLTSGQHTFTVRAEDAQGNVEGLSRTVLVDDSPPRVALTGPLAASADAPFKARAADLTIASEDPRPGSGIASVEVELDEAEVPGFPLACTGECASFRAGYRYLASRAGPGEHTVAVEVTDRAGNRTSRTIAVNVPAAAEGTPACSAEAEEVPAAAVVAGPEAAQVMEQGLPQALAASKPGEGELDQRKITPTLRAHGADLEAAESLAEAKISTAPEGGIKLNRIACLTPGETTNAATGAELVNEDAAMFANTGPATDTAIRPTASGVMMVRDLRGPEAAASYTWNVKLNQDEKLVKLPSGMVAIVEPVPGGVGEAVDPPPAPNNLEEPRALANAQVQRHVAEYEIALAQTETQASVVAVIAQPWILLADETVIPATITVAPVVLEPNEFILTVHLPLNERAAEIYPVQVVETASISTSTGSCLHAHSPCGTPNLDSAAQYAVFWGNEHHQAFGHKARNPMFEDFGSNNCTNFLSQIVRAGGQRFMLWDVHGDGSWWYKRFVRYEDTLQTAFAYAEYTRSWSLADELPRHLWQYGLFHIDPVHEPYGWTKGDLLAEDWFGSGGKGNFDHVQFVVGTETVGAGGREPLIANESSEGANYSSKPWFRVRERIEEEHGGDGWERLALAWKHTMANVDEKKHTPANLYGPDGYFHE
jgi:Putative amidase domain